jgi:archaellum biogenesis ATPase FlaH
MRVPYTDMRETVAEYFDIGHAVDKDLMEYRKDLIEIFPRRARPIARASSRTTNAQSAARFIQQHQTILVDRLSRWIGDSDKRVITRFLRQLQALCTHEHMVVPDARRTEKLVELTVVATWHVLDGIHRLS